ncbi:MAG: PEP-CTERM sorting domain-containing protein [Phycisphaeraceae bacterium]
MKTMTPMIGAAAALLGTSASATVLFGPAVSGLNQSNGAPANGPSKTMAIIDVDNDGLAGFNLGAWDGSSFLPDANDVIVNGINGLGNWNEATGDGDGFEALVPNPQDNSVLDASGTPYEINVASTNTPSVVGGGDRVYLFFFPGLSPAASSPGSGQAFGIIDLGVLPGTFGNLSPNLISPASDYRAIFTTVGGLPGDTDGDGDIDDTDLGTSFVNYTGPLPFGTGGKTAADGDTDGDGDVDDTDLGTLFVNYTGPLSPASVPEPTSLALLGLGGLVVLRRRRA